MSWKTAAHAMAALLLAALVTGCPSDGGDEPDPGPQAETLTPEPKWAPKLPDDKARLTCVGKNAPGKVVGTSLELTGYVRALGDPSAKQAAPEAQVEAFSASGTSLGKSFADVAKGKDGRVSVSVPVKAEGFTGYAMITHADYVDWRMQVSRPITDTVFTGWAFLATPAELTERGKKLGLEQSSDKGLIVGSVHDCDGFGVQFALVQIEGSIEGVLYVEGFDVVKADERTFTSETGRFVIPNVAPGEVTIKAFGRLTKGGPLTLLSKATVTSVAGKMTAITMQPRMGLTE